MRGVRRAAVIFMRPWLLASADAALLRGRCGAGGAAAVAPVALRGAAPRCGARQAKPCGGAAITPPAGLRAARPTGHAFAPSAARACSAVGGGAHAGAAAAVAAPADAPAHAPAATAAPATSYQLVTFYCFTRLEDPHAEVARHKTFCQARDIKGRIYVNEQGINAQLSGGGGDAVAYAEWVTSDARFAGTRVSVYEAPGHSFPRLTLRYKANLVQLEGGTQHLDLSAPEKRARELTPAEWREQLRARAAGNGPPLLLDVRNGYEWDTGRFQGAERPVTECFRETVQAFSAPDGPLAGVAPDTPVMMYCTGGIRCDVYSAVLKEKGFTNLFTLKGGVQAYLDSFGKEDDGWEGHLFVFDSRLAMTADKRPSALAGEAAAAGGLKCHCCASPQAVAPHRNCPNVDCNRLFLVCPGCLQKHGGFCCDRCAAATHVRPTLVQPGQHYARWSHYADGTPGATTLRRGEGRRLRRQRRKERRKEQEHEWAVAAVAAALSGEPVDAGAAAAAANDDGTAERRSRAARLAAALGGPAGWKASDADADVAAGDDEARWGITGSSRYAKMRKALRDEAAARLAAQQGGAAAATGAAQ